MRKIMVGVKSSDQCMRGIGYKETYAYINGHINHSEYIDLLKKNTRHYAKRQFTWMKRYNDAEFIAIEEEYDVSKIISDIVKQLY